MSAVSYARQLLLAIAERLDWKALNACTPRARCWNGQRLVLMAWLMAWQPGGSLGRRFDQARRVLRQMLPKQRLGRSYTGYADALAAASPALLEALTGQLQGPLEPALAGWRALAADGTRCAVPRSAANEQAFPRSGRQRSGPQLGLLAVRNQANGRLWAFRVAPAICNERTLLRRLLPLLPPGALLVLDAGFSGYELLEQMRACGLHFLARVGAGTRLLEGLRLVRQRKGIVYLWPQWAAQLSLPPLVLRQIVLRPGNGATPLYLLTDVLDGRALPAWVAGRLYRGRWGVEVDFRTLKQVLGFEHLQSRQPRRAECELSWAVASLWLLQALGQPPEAHARPSPAGRLACVRQAISQCWWRRPPQTLGRALRRARRDDYRRHSAKVRRPWPRKKRKPPPRPPKLAMATERQVAQAKALAQGPHPP